MTTLHNSNGDNNKPDAASDNVSVMSHSRANDVSREIFFTPIISQRVSNLICGLLLQAFAACQPNQRFALLRQFRTDRLSTRGALVLASYPRSLVQLRPEDEEAIAAAHAAAGTPAHVAILDSLPAWVIDLTSFAAQLAARLDAVRAARVELFADELAGDLALTLTKDSPATSALAFVGAARNYLKTAFEWTPAGSSFSTRVCGALDCLTEIERCLDELAPEPPQTRGARTRA